MLPLEIIKKYYPNASEKELMEIQEIVYLLVCAVMQHFYGPPLGEPRPSGGSEWMGDFEEVEQEKKTITLRLVRFPCGY